MRGKLDRRLQFRPFLREQVGSHSGEEKEGEEEKLPHRQAETRFVVVKHAGDGEDQEPCAGKSNSKAHDRTCAG